MSSPNPLSGLDINIQPYFDLIHTQIVANMEKEKCPQEDIQQTSSAIKVIFADGTIVRCVKEIGTKFLTTDERSNAHQTVIKLFKSIALAMDSKDFPSLSNENKRILGMCITTQLSHTFKSIYETNIGKKSVPNINEEKKSDEPNSWSQEALLKYQEAIGRMPAFFMSNYKAMSPEPSLFQKGLEMLLKDKSILDTIAQYLKDVKLAQSNPNAFNRTLCKVLQTQTFPTIIEKLAKEVGEANCVLMTMALNEDQFLNILNGIQLPRPNILKFRDTTEIDDNDFPH